MTRFRWDGKDFDLIERPLVPEIAAIERERRMGSSKWTESESNAACVLISLRRAGTALTWKDIETIPPRDFIGLTEDGDPIGEADGTDPTRDDDATLGRPSTDG